MDRPPRVRRGGAPPRVCDDSSVLGGGSIQLARVLGIRIGVDRSWFLVLFLVIWFLSGTYREVLSGSDEKAFALAVLSALLFFASILLHELGHAVVALRNGIPIAGIDLWLLGGIARMRAEPRTAGVEFRVAAAGPVVSAAIVGVCLGAAALAPGAEPILGGTFDEGRVNGDAETILGFLAYVNLAVLLLNLLPAFPLDGGRIARALVWWRTGDKARATRLAARAGRGFAYVLIGLGLAAAAMGDLVGGIWLGFVGLFVSQAARGEELRSRMTERIEGLRVADVMDPEPVALPGPTALDRALEEFFLRYRWPWFPVTDAAGRFLGYVRREQVDDVPEELRAARTVDSVMSRDQGSVGLDEPLEALLGSETLQQLGAVAAVDAEGVLRGVVTLDRVRRALRPATPAV
jgi:Zn-dependent protease